MSGGRRYLLLTSLTAVFLGYLMVWLPGPAVGLSFLGFEIGEWIKFLGVRTSRNLFYLPPITLGLMMVFLSVLWPVRGWQRWGWRALAVAVSWLSFPALVAILEEPPSEWLLRLLLVGLVLIVALFADPLRRLPVQVIWVLVALLGLCGLALPSWRYLTLRPFLADVLGTSVGIGIGVWLNGAGHLLATSLALLSLRNLRTGARGI